MESSYFQPNGKLGVPILWKTMVSYPWMRIRNCVKFIFTQNRSLVWPLIYCFPVLVLGIYSAAWGALVRGFTSTQKETEWRLSVRGATRPREYEVYAAFTSA